MPQPDPAIPDLERLLRDAETIAVVGCSDVPGRTSHAIARYLQTAGFRVIPVNPHHEEVLGARCYPDLDAIPDEVRLDVVNIFRRPTFTAGHVRAAVMRARRTGEHPVVWTQLGVSSAEAEEVARAAGLPYIRNRCIMVEHRRGW